MGRIKLTEKEAEYLSAFVKKGRKSALKEKPRSGQPKKYTERHEAEIIAQACTKSPDGSKRWSLTLLTEELRKKEGFETINLMGSTI